MKASLSFDKLELTAVSATVCVTPDALLVTAGLNFLAFIYIRALSSAETSIPRSSDIFSNSLMSLSICTFSDVLRLCAVLIAALPSARTCSSSSAVISSPTVLKSDVTASVTVFSAASLAACSSSVSLSCSWPAGAPDVT